MRLRRKDVPFDPHEMGARRNDPELAALEPLPPAPKRISTGRLVMLFVAGVALVALLRDGVGSGPPAVDGSCTKPAFALNRSYVRQFAALKWSANGPADARLVIGTDTKAVPTTPADGLLAGPLPLPGCKASGLVGIPMPEGDHVIRAYLLRADGSSTLINETKVSVQS